MRIKLALALVALANLATAHPVEPNAVSAIPHPRGEPIQTSVPRHEPAQIKREEIKREANPGAKAKEWWYWWWWSPTTTTETTSHIPTLTPAPFVTTRPYCVYSLNSCWPDPGWTPDTYLPDGKYSRITSLVPAWSSSFSSIESSEMARYLSDQDSYYSYTSSFYQSYWSSYSAVHPAKRTAAVERATVRDIPVETAPPTPVMRFNRRQMTAAPSATGSPNSDAETQETGSPVPPAGEKPAAGETPDVETSNNPTNPSSGTSSGAGAGTPKKRRIAVVGAGASGSGAAFFLARAARVVEAKLGLAADSLAEIVVYDKNDYIGGRAATVIEPFTGNKLEIGAAMMVNANMNLRKVAAMFNLPLIFLPGGGTGPMDMWDGNKVVYSNTGTVWWDRLTSIARYGLLSKTRQAVALSKFLQRISRAYSPSLLAQRGPVSSIKEFADSLQLGEEYTGRSAYNFAMTTIGVSSRWANEMMDSMTRSNYRADITAVHGAAVLAGAAVSEGALIMLGGNNLLFQAMMGDSNATVHLSTEVTDIVPSTNGYILSTNNGNETFDEVFWGNPWHLSSVSKGMEFTTPIPEQEYVKVHLTYVGTTAPSPNAKYFKRSKGAMSQVILTTGEGARSGGPSPDFQLLMYNLALPTSNIVLIFSPEALPDSKIIELFGSTTWIFRKEWDAYPLLKPTTSFPPVLPRAGFHYLAAMEPWLSTMETQTLSAREAVARAVNSWWNLGMAECKDGSSWDMACDAEPPHAPTYDEFVKTHSAAAR
ncbi:hypothetical protein CspHIS471_0405890 [Cutaneotrichosporon sp. HIS471]|nr:hypothetical protein CspHIS471_0405890 [Cutaneotrichosporon sp. HIS471]